MNLFIDGEWDGDRLLSLALVSEPGLEWYRVLSDWALSDWVQQNVVPKLGAAPVPKIDAQKSMVEFLSQFESVHIIADWPEDIAQFCNFLITGPGLRIPTPPLTMEIRRDLNCNESVTPHNALSDARALRLMYLEAK